VSFESTSEGLRTTRLAPWLPRRLLHHGRGYVRSYGRVWRRRAAAVWAGGRQAAAAAAEVTAEVARPGLHALRRMRDWLVTRRHRATTEVCATCSPSPPHRCVCATGWSRAATAPPPRCVLSVAPPLPTAVCVTLTLATHHRESTCVARYPIVGCRGAAAHWLQPLGRHGGAPAAVEGRERESGEGCCTCSLQLCRHVEAGAAKGAAVDAAGADTGGVTRTGGAAA
jgi:hypothetical protein